jgi:hypothetical protein
MKAPTCLNQDDLHQLLSVVRRHWPEISYYERSVVVIALNRVQEIAEKEGVAAITPPRLEGLREIIEEYVIPFAEVARIRELITDQATKESS